MRIRINKKRLDAFCYFLWLVIFIFMIVAIMAGCGSTHQTTRATQGAALGAGIGLLTGDGRAAAGLGLVGGVIGSVIGAFETEKKEEKNTDRRRAPLEWLLSGKRTKVVAVKGGWSYSDVVRTTVEKALKSKGALIVASSSSAKKEENLDFIVGVYAQQSGEYVHASIEIIDVQTSVIRAIGTGRAWFSYGYGGYGYDNYRSYVRAVRIAMADLH